MELAAGEAPNIWDSGRNNQFIEVLENDCFTLNSTAAGILTLVAQDNNIEIDLQTDKRLRIQDENDIMLVHEGGASVGGPAEIDLRSTRIIEAESGTINADHTTVADQMWLVDSDDGTTYEVPLRTH